jgi:hypothetical protein
MNAFSFVPADLLVAVPLLLIAASARWGLLEMARRGHSMQVATTIYCFAVAFFATLLLASIVSLLTGRATGVWSGLAAAGLLGTLMLAWNGPALWREQRLSEERRMSARDL